MTGAVGWLPTAVTELFGEEATAEEAYDLLTVDVPAGSWTEALETARDGLGCTYFDWLSAVDEPGTGFRVCAHVVSLPGGADGRAPRRLLVRTTVPHEDPALPTITGVYAGAAWHERETYEMFGIAFTGHPHLVPLLLPEGFEGHPLRKDFVLAARVAKAWPGAKEPGESEHGGPKRRQMLPPGVPDPNDWGPLKGQLPPAPARAARTPRAAGAAGERPARPPRAAEAAAGAPLARGVSTGPAGRVAESSPPRTPDAPWEQPRPAEDGEPGAARGARPRAAEGDHSGVAEDAPSRAGGTGAAEGIEPGAVERDHPRAGLGGRPDGGDQPHHVGGGQSPPAGGERPGSGDGPPRAAGGERPPASGGGQSPASGGGRPPASEGGRPGAAKDDPPPAKGTSPDNEPAAEGEDQ